MKLFFFIVCLFIIPEAFTQTKSDIRYIELRGSIDFFGNINIGALATNKKQNKTDSLSEVDEKQINNIIGKYRSQLQF